MACQSCHIPTYARINPTKMFWDWSTAGDTKRKVNKDEFGKPDYDPKKGDFVWGKNEVPRYEWFNGSIRGTTAKDVVDPSTTVRVSWPIGDVNDPNSRIFPFKVHAGKTPYDKVNKTMVIPKLFGPKGSGAYWAEYDWDRAISVGQVLQRPALQRRVRLRGHGVRLPHHAHGGAQGPGRGLRGVSRQGRPSGPSGRLLHARARLGSRLLNTGGWALVVASLLGVALHGLGRFFSSVGRRRG